MKDKDQAGKLIDIERVFAEKNPTLFKLIPSFIIKYLKRITHQDEINEFIASSSNVSGIAYIEKILSELTPADVSYIGLENVPANGRYLFVANHPLGGIDGLAFILAASNKFKDIKFPVNDILLNLKGLQDFFIPINKHGAHSREAARIMEETFQSNSQILFFPAGMVSRKKNGKITDLEWKKSFLKKAISSNRDIVPVYISGKNSNFFYNLSNIRSFLGIKANIEMLYLADEMFNYNGKKIVVNFGTPIPCDSIKTNLTPNEWVKKIRDTAYLLSANC